MTIRGAVLGVEYDAVMLTARTCLRKPSMARTKAKQALTLIQELMAEASFVLSKAQSFQTIGMGETAQTLWQSAASLKERIAPLLDSEGEPLEAAVYRMSAASCYEKSGDLSRAVNLYQAALSGPLNEGTRREVEGMLAVCLPRLRGIHRPRKRGEWHQPRSTRGSRNITSS
jgi:hypothetical protein